MEISVNSITKSSEICLVNISINNLYINFKGLSDRNRSHMRLAKLRGYYPQHKLPSLIFHYDSMRCQISLQCVHRAQIVAQGARLSFRLQFEVYQCERDPTS